MADSIFMSSVPMLSVRPPKRGLYKNNTSSYLCGQWLRCKNSAVCVDEYADDTVRRLADYAGKKYYKIVADENFTTDPDNPTDGLTELTSDRVSVTQDGVWYVYYKHYDQAGDDSTGREGNKTEGLVGPIRIDAKAPALAAEPGSSETENLKIPIEYL